MRAISSSSTLIARIAAVGHDCWPRVCCQPWSIRWASKIQVLRQLQVFVPPDMAVRAGADQILAALGLHRIDQYDAVGALLDRAGLVGLDAGRVVAVIAHGRNVGDVDHRHLPAFLLQDVDPLVAVLGHRRRIAGPVIADIFVHGGERAQIAVGALGHVDDQVPFLHESSTLLLPLPLRCSARRVEPRRARRRCAVALGPSRAASLAASPGTDEVKVILPAPAAPL